MTFLIKNNKIRLATFSLFFSLVPIYSNAQSVILSTGKSTYATNDSILVTVTLQTGGQQINTIGGQVYFTAGSISVSDLRFGNSIISLWVEKPIANNASGIIPFTGGVPGGFSGSSGNIFTFVVKPKTEGNLNIGLKDVKVLLNDGTGSELQRLKLIPLSLNITKPKTNTTQAPTPVIEKINKSKDLVSPEPFVPMVSHHPSIAENDYFVSFFAVDKDSGVVKYEVREVYKIFGIANDWVEAVSPHVLKVQGWGTKVEVRATDGSGNSVISNADKPFSSTILYILVTVLLLVTIIFTKKFTGRGRIRRNK